MKKLYTAKEVLKFKVKGTFDLGIRSMHHMKMKRHFFLVILLLILSINTPAAAPPTFSELKQGAAAGDPWAQLNLGAAYDHGFGGAPKDLSKAVYWYRASAEQGVDKAQFNLGYCLATGLGVPQNLVEARIWMRKAAMQDMPDAQYLIGVMLADGLGGDIDLIAARYWLEKSSKGGNTNAAEHLTRLK